MSLLQQIKNDQLQARKERDAVAGSLLTTLIGEAAMPGKNDGNRESTDAEVVQTIKKFIKNTNELLKVLETEGGPAPMNMHAHAKACMELDILQSYLPKQLSEDELKVAITCIGSDIALAGQKPNVGTIMKELKMKFDGQYDGQLASKLVKEALQ